MKDAFDLDLSRAIGRLEETCEHLERSLSVAEESIKALRKDLDERVPKRPTGEFRFNEETWSKRQRWIAAAFLVLLTFFAEESWRQASTAKTLVLEAHQDISGMSEEVAKLTAFTERGGRATSAELKIVADCVLQRFLDVQSRTQGVPPNETLQRIRDQCIEDLGIVSHDLGKR
jgi:hypothetical protein